MDTHQAVYDAVRSRISNCDIGTVVGDVARDAFSLGNFHALLTEQLFVVSHELQRPSAIYRPQLSADGTAWCALYGDNLQVGVAGFGDTPDEAMRAFDEAWRKERTPAAHRSAA